MGDYPDCTFAELQVAFCKRTENLEWWTSLLVVEKHEAWEEWKSGSLLWKIVEVGQ
jgi:hypothetical protein